MAFKPFTKDAPKGKDAKPAKPGDKKEPKGNPFAKFKKK